MGFAYILNILWSAKISISELQLFIVVITHEGCRIINECRIIVACLFDKGWNDADLISMTFMQYAFINLFSIFQCSNYPVCRPSNNLDQTTNQLHVISYGSLYCTFCTLQCSVSCDCDEHATFTGLTADWGRIDRELRSDWPRDTGGLCPRPAQIDFQPLIYLP